MLSLVNYVIKICSTSNIQLLISERIFFLTLKAYFRPKKQFLYLFMSVCEGQLNMFRTSQQFRITDIIG